jgi:isocitrate/isopropylmalate dehydrogenase
MILACGALLGHIDDPKAANASRAIYESVLETVRDGISTGDIGGHATTSEFTDAVIGKITTKLDVWSSL